MAHLTKDQLEFVNKHRISVSDIFDASGLRPSEYKKLMMQRGKIYAIGVTACAKSGHTIRSRSGNCIQCNPATISFERRHNSGGYVYIAGSMQLEKIKVGSSTDPKNRLYIANIESYSGASDWKLLAKVWANNSGEFEKQVHGRLAQFASSGMYAKGTKQIISRETFQCGYNCALFQLRSLLAQDHAGIAQEPGTQAYEFKQ